MAETAPIQPARLKEAREYLGFTREDVATALRCSPMLVEAMEEGGASLGGEMVRRLCRLYRRPLAWLQGETTFQPSASLLRKVEHLHPQDREAILDFAEWLQDAGPPPKPARERP